MTTTTFKKHRPQSELEATLGQTELGSFLFRHRIWLSALLILLLAGGGGFFYYKKLRQKNLQEYAELTYQFETGSWQQFKEKKIAYPEYLKRLEALETKISDPLVLGLLWSQTSKELQTRKLNSEAISFLESRSQMIQDPLYSFLLKSGLYALYEDAGDLQKAITIANQLLNSPEIYLKPQLYFDLGRLHLNTGNQDQARVHFQYIIDEFKEEGELVKLSEVYLQDIVTP